MLYFWGIFTVCFILYVFNKAEQKSKELKISEDKKYIGVAIAGASSIVISLALLASFFGYYKTTLPFSFPLNRIWTVIVLLFLIDCLYLKRKYPDPDKLAEKEKQSFRKHILISFILFIFSLCIFPVILGVLQDG